MALPKIFHFFLKLFNLGVKYTPKNITNNSLYSLLFAEQMCVSTMERQTPPLSLCLTFRLLRVHVQRQVSFNDGTKRREQRFQILLLAKVRQIPDEDAPGFDQSVVAVRLQRRRFQLPRRRVAFKRRRVLGGLGVRFADLCEGDPDKSKCHLFRK